MDILLNFPTFSILLSYLILSFCGCTGYSLNVGTPFWKLVLKQFDDLLVKILIAAAAVSFFLALINGETGLTAFLEPSVRNGSFGFHV